MKKDQVVCIRLDYGTTFRMGRALSKQYPSKSKFIRAAIMQMILQEEAKARVDAAAQKIHWV